MSCTFWVIYVLCYPKNVCHNYFWWLFLTLLLAVCHPLFCHLLDSTKSPPDAYTLAAKLILSRKKKNDQMPTANKIESPNQKTLGVADVEFCIMCVHIYVYTYVYMFFNICTHHGTTKHKCKMLIFRSIRRYLHFCAFWMVYIYIYVCIICIMYIIYVYVCIYSYMHTHGFLQKCDHWSSTLLAIFQHGNVLASFSVAASRKYPKPGIPSTSGSTGYVGIQHISQ